MNLTGKAKSDFEYWVVSFYKKNRPDYNKFTFDLIFRKHYRKTTIEQNALIIEWFDSVGFSLNNEPSVNFMEQQIWFKPTINLKYIEELRVADFKTRTEATNEAIKKANLIYNQL